MVIDTDFNIMVMSKGGYNKQQLREMDFVDYEYLYKVAKQWQEKLYPETGAK